MSLQGLQPGHELRLAPRDAQPALTEQLFEVSHLTREAGKIILQQYILTCGEYVC